MPSALWRIDEPQLLVGAVVAFLVVMELAYRLGRRNHSRSDDVLRAHVLGLQTALVGLLSLLLGFNFAMAVARFDARKTLLQEEISAINTMHLRAQLLPARDRQDATDLLKTYVAARVDFMQAADNDAMIDAASVAAARIQRRLWAVVERAAAQSTSAVPTGQFIQAVNDMITANDKRRAALDNRVPATVLHLLAGVALVALGFIAYGWGLTGRPRHCAAVVFALLIAVVLTVIVDLDRPRSGLIRVSEAGMIRLQETLDR
jgi:ABC-type Fe3+-siderophore transport system permease subunit